VFRLRRCLPDGPMVMADLQSVPRQAARQVAYGEGVGVALTYGLGLVTLKTERPIADNGVGRVNYRHLATVADVREQFRRWPLLPISPPRSSAFHAQ
jgi:hypothetical protein